MTEKEVKDSIQKEFSIFMAQPFPELLPTWYLKKFPKVFMHIPQSASQLHGHRIEELLNKTLKDLNIFEVGTLSNIYAAAPPKAFGWLGLSVNMRKYAGYKKQIDKVVEMVNKLTGGEDERLKRKEYSMMKNVPRTNNNMKSVHK